MYNGLGRRVAYLEEKELSILIEERDHETVKMVVRHAQRPMFKGTKAPHEVSITEKGKEEAEKLGRLLRKYDLSIEWMRFQPGSKMYPDRRAHRPGKSVPGQSGYQSLSGRFQPFQRR